MVVINHRTPDLLHACVASLERHMPAEISYKVFTVDNSPPDEAVGDYVIENRGYGQACNYGASLGDAPNLLILNADTEMRADSDIEWCLYLLSLPRTGVLGPKQVSPYGWIASAGCPPANNGVGYTIRGWKQPDMGQFTEDLLDCMYVPGSVVFTRREVWEKLGGFLETPLYYEETFYCYLARHRGYRCVYTGRSVWLHHWDSSPKANQQMLSNRPVARESHAMFEQACLSAGITDIPPFI